MWAYPLRNAEKANKAKIPYDNHAKPLRKSKKKTKNNKSIQENAGGSLHQVLPQEMQLV